MSLSPDIQNSTPEISLSREELLLRADEARGRLVATGFAPAAEIYAGFDLVNEAPLGLALGDMWPKYGSDKVPGEELVRILTERGHNTVGINPEKLKEAFLEKCGEEVVNPWGFGDTPQMLIDLANQMATPKVVAQ